MLFGWKCTAISGRLVYLMKLFSLITCMIRLYYRLICISNVRKWWKIRSRVSQNLHMQMFTFEKLPPDQFWYFFQLLESYQILLSNNLQCCQYYRFGKHMVAFLHCDYCWFNFVLTKDTNLLQCDAEITKITLLLSQKSSFVYPYTVADVNPYFRNESKRPGLCPQIRLCFVIICLSS